MLKSSRLFKRKAAGMMAAVMMIGILPVNMIGFADVLEMPPDSYEDLDEHKATRSNASYATASNALKTQELKEEGTVYYVDAKNGKDSGDGKTEETAWKTFDRVNLFTWGQDTVKIGRYLESGTESQRKRPGGRTHHH